MHSNVVIWVNNKVYIFGSMTLNITHVRGKGGFDESMTLKLGRCVFVRYLRMCAKFRGSRVNSCRENSFWGGSNFVMIGFSSNFHLSFQEFKFCFSLSMFHIDCLCLLRSGVNIAGPVFLPKNTFIKHGCQSHYWWSGIVISHRCLSEIFSFIVMFASCLLCSFSTAMLLQPIIHFPDHTVVVDKLT